MGPSATPCCVGFLRVPSSITSVGDLLWLFCTDCLDLRELRFGGGGDAGVGCSQCTSLCVYHRHCWRENCCEDGCIFGVKL